MHYRYGGLYGRDRKKIPGETIENMEEAIKISGGSTMWFWLFLFLCNLLIPVLMIFIGWTFLAHPPKTINGIYGYRTFMSSKNQDTWDFAHQYCGKLWWKIGWIILPISIVVQLPFVHSTNDTIGYVTMILETVQCVVLISSIFPVEKALKENFDKDGNRKKSMD